jgi:hypothetical protein
MIADNPLVQAVEIRVLVDIVAGCVELDRHVAGDRRRLHGRLTASVLSWRTLH